MSTRPSRQVACAIGLVALLAACGSEPSTPTDVLEAELDELGYEGTIDDPIPAGTAAPVEPGRFTLSVGAITPVTAEELTTADPNAILDQLEPGFTFALVDVSVTNPASEFTADPGGYSYWPLFGNEDRSIYYADCGSLAIDIGQQRIELAAGESAEGQECLQVREDAIDTVLIGVEAGVTGRMVVFDPA